ncbi:tryptophan 2,3-dioxygenase family protein [Actinomycetospora lutea]|uniref:tryptophan 2,3-dioxygenase family protein n=1 Tax=Actinomycetospora lutea TaxID=663604 RepID=UPI0023657A2B|nr:tryptophan 2,3-dioxygenase family protein [Actinomycetospora lutea]MDD7939056.1 tryptophan 2,3-dioxygenase family protein [Actinomycetospora lutea]
MIEPRDLATPAEGLALARLVTGEIRRIGRHALPDTVLDALAEIADQHRGRDPFLDAFLDAVLARHRDRFRNAGYLALPLLEEILRDTALTAERLSALLLADVVRHENRHPGAVDPALRRKRIRQAMRFVGTVERSPADDAPPPRTLAGDWLELTVLPVSTEHDEYFFIRALQAHELVFTTLTGLVRSATDAVRAGRHDEATALLRRASSVFERASLLFRLVATMRPAAFHAFRRFTEGASAIQSESYKRFELACGEPGPARLDSEAFAGVPAVRAEAGHHDNLARALADGPRSQVLDAAAADLEQAHQRWKTTHHGLAARMLGDATGSGYTAGVPYLAACRENRLMVVRDHAA